MIKENLNCSVSNCKYNINELCNAGIIHICGANADKPYETCCASFVENGGMSSSCECSFQDITRPDDIKCDAIKCTYNNNNICHADKVKIDFPNVCCSTFKKN